MSHVKNSGEQKHAIDQHAFGGTFQAAFDPWRPVVLLLLNPSRSSSA